MARKKKQINSGDAASMLDTLVMMRLAERWITLIDDAQREVAETLSDFDPMWSGNLFAKLRDAVVNKDPQAVVAILDEFSHINERLSDVRENLLDLRARITSVPEVYGGNGDDDAG